MKNWYRIIPYISLGLASLILLLLSIYVGNKEIKDILANTFSNSLFFFIAYLFYDLVRQVVINKERKYLTEYIKNRISNDIFVALYFLKKVINGYNLDSNTTKNISSIIGYSKREVLSSVRNQNYLGFQIFKGMDEVRSLFREALNDNLILKYSSHVDCICILKIANNLTLLESILKTPDSFNTCAEQGVEFNIVSGKDINPENDEKYLLLKKTSRADRFVVYDSGFFKEEDLNKLLNRFVLKEEAVVKIADVLFEIFHLMGDWIPEIVRLSRNDSRFRIIKKFLSINTGLRTKKTKVFVADIIDLKTGNS
jgi:hypothetical protein